MTETFDFIGSGAGSAGCVVAARLSESGQYSVLLLEAGPEDFDFFIGMPMGFPMLFTNPKVNWMFESEAVAELGGRRMFQPRGKVLGGTSSINGMVYIRGHAWDYDQWRQLGCVGWGYEDVLPYFRKSENQQRGEDAFHGVGGMLSVSNQVERSPISGALVAAAQQAGIPFTADFNGAQQEGVGSYQVTVRRGRRHNTSQAYLRAARRRRNLKVVTGAQAIRVVIAEGLARGITYRFGDGVRTALARREVVLCGGAFGSPHLLQLSGVGPAEHLREFGIGVASDRPQVGAHLMDHFQGSTVFRCKAARTINEVANSAIRRVLAGAQYVLFRGGALATNGIHTGIFTRTDPALDRPNLQITSGLWSIAGSTEKGLQPHPFPAFTLNPVLLNPIGSGSVRLGSADPLVNPVIRQSFLTHRQDVEAMMAGLRLIRSIVGQPAIAPYVESEVAPGRDIEDDAQMEAYLRATGVANLHPVGSCRMGADEGAVVDPRLRVRGVAGLRVADASIMPTLPAGNTNAPTIMIGEKASAMILEDAR